MNEWTQATLGDLAELLDGKRIPVNEEQRGLMKGIVPYYGANGVQGFVNRSIFNEPLILLAEDGGYFDDFAERPIAYRIAGPSWVNNHAHVLRAKRGIDQGFLFYALEHKDIRRFIKGGTRSKLNASDLREIDVRYPKSDYEQRSIAELLSTMDEQIEQTEAETEKLDQMIPGAFDDAFGAGLAGKLTRGALKSGELRAGWARVPISGAVSEILDFRGRTPLKLGMDWGGGDIAALSANNVEMGRVNFSKECYLGSDALYKKWMTHGDCGLGDVLMTLEAPLGNVALVPDERRYILSQRVVLLKPNLQLLNGEYLHLYLRWRWFQQLLIEESTGTTASGIQRKKLEKLPVLVPPEKQRTDITQLLSTMLSQQTLLRAEHEKLRLKKQGLAQDLLTGRVRTQQ